MDQKTTKPEVEKQSTAQLLRIQEEQKEPPSLLATLRDFERSIIARFLSRSDKLLKMGLLNKQCQSLVRKHYSWLRFPSPGPYSLFSDFVPLFDSLT